MAVHAAIYVRVSTDEQDTENQLPALQQIAASRGYTIVETFAERMSGTKRSRPAFDRLLEGARRGRYQIILVWAVDRLGRHMSAIVDTVIALDKLGVQVISHQEPWLDTHTSVRPLMLSIFAWVAQQERERLVERTRAGMARARAAGKSIGRPAVKIDLNEAVRLRKQGLTLEAAAKKLGVGRSTLHRALMSPDVPDSVRGHLTVAN